jgi:hypothetical protein
MNATHRTETTGKAEVRHDVSHPRLKARGLARQALTDQTQPARATFGGNT